MKKNLVLLLCLALLLSTCFMSCDVLGGNDDCDHTFSEDWDSDATNHWHPATCEHGEQKDSLANHVDSDEDGACDVCAYECGHVHTFEAEWSMNDTHHWKNATCSHSDVEGEKSMHADEDENGVCEVCSSHVHAANAAGYCKYDGCGDKIAEIDETDLEALIYAFIEQSGLINGGKMDYEFTGRSNVDEEGFSTYSTRLVEYLFGKDGYTYTKTANETSAVARTVYYMEGWYSPDGVDSTFGIVSEDGGLTYTLDMSDGNKLYGFYLAVSSLADGHGAEAVLLSLFEASLSDRVTDLVIEANPDENKLSFSYSVSVLQVSTIAVGDNVGSQVYNLAHYDVEVSLSYTDDFALTELNIKTDCYTNDPGALQNGQLNEADVDIDYDPDTDTYTFRETALADSYVISITQSVGERTAENPNPKSKFVPKSFELFLNMNAETGELSGKYDGSILTSALRQIINLYVGEYAPVGTSLHYVPEYASIKVYRNGEEVLNPESYDNETVVAMLTFSGEQRSFFVIPKMEGAYKLEIYLGDALIKTVHIHVGEVDEEFVEVADNQFAVKVTETYEWHSEYTFTATETGTYCFNLPAGVGFIDADGVDAAANSGEIPAPYFDFNSAKNPDGSFNPGSFYLNLEEGQTVRFYVSAAKRGTYVITFFTL